MANPYTEGNPYIIRKRQNTTGPQLVNLGLKLYTIKNAAGGKETRLKIGDTKPGEALKIPEQTVETEGLDSFDFGKGGEQADIPADAALIEPAETGVIPGAVDLYEFGGGIESGAGLDGQIGTEGLDAFDFGGGIESGLGFGEQIGAASEVGGGIESGYGFAGQIGAETGAEAGGATIGSALGTVGSAASTAMPYIAAARIGMPILGKAMKGLPGHENSSSVMGQMAALTQKDYMRPMERLTELALTDGKPLPKWTGIFNPAGHLMKYACIIVSACTSRDSYEVNVARQFRDKHMDEVTLTGYYALCVFVVPFINKSPMFRRIVKRVIVDRLVDYGEWRMGMRPEMRYGTSRFVKRAFLGLCRHVGYGVDTILQGQEV
ncbi:MAG TPA: hypothetical protein VLH56_16430 [Dissulfurispiraceae bacterium]|nr:hypothetical protein [Dissulfurispiraceae bacterium]